jgi:arylsulfatase A-like enzyme
MRQDQVIKKNVILITIDCLRVDHLSCYGYKRKTTPFIDFLAKEGMRFENAFANGPFTVASFLSILASAYPLDFKNPLPLSEDAILISEILKNEGIQTAAIHSNPYLSSFYGYNRSWDYFEDFLHINPKNDTEKNSKRKQIKHLIKKFFPKRVIDLYLRVADLHSVLKILLGKNKTLYENAETITNHAILWSDNNKKSPFFLWLHYMDLHEPYSILNMNIKRKYSKNISRLTHAKLLTKQDIGQEDIENIINIYDDKLRYVDENLKELFDFLENEKLTNNTAIILTSDHGQEFLDHGHYGHSARFYDENIHIPLILFGPEIEKQINDKLVSQIDITPTVLYFYNILVPKGYHGHNLLSNHANDYIISEAAHNEKGVYIQGHKIFPSKFRTYAIRTKNWKYIHKEKECDLYDLRKDPKEEHNISNTHEEIGNEFSKILEYHLTERKIIHQEKNEKEEIGQKIKELKNLGKI